MSPLFNKRTITLVDTSGILHRCVHSPQAQRVTQYTQNPWAGPTFLFYQSILTVCTRFDNVVFVLDGYPKSKHELFPAYKAQRKAQREKDPEYEFQKEVRKQLRNWIFETIPTVIAYSPFEEADDCIGSLAHQLNEKNIRVDILSSDKDIWQLCNDSTHVWRIGSEGFEEISDEMIAEEYGVPADKIPHYKAWFGDKSDNLPKIFRMPTKIATALINGTSSLDEAIQRLPEFVEGDWLPKFQEFTEQAKVNLNLATISKDLKVPFAYFAPEAINLQALLNAYQIKGYSAADLFGRLQPAQRSTLEILVEVGLLNGQTVLSYDELSNKPKPC